MTAAALMKVVILAHRPVIRTGLRWMLQEDPAIGVVEAESMVVARHASLREDSDVLLVDLSAAPGSAALDEAIDLAGFAGAALVVVSEEPEFLSEASERGVDGYLLRDATAAGLIASVRDAVGRNPRPPGLGDHVVVVLPSEERIRGVGGELSPREEQVFRLLARGYKNSEIAHELGISIRTVESHRARVNDKLGQPTRAEMVRIAEGSGYVATSGLAAV